MTRKQYRRVPVREGAVLLRGSCGTEREGHPPSMCIRRTTAEITGIRPVSAGKGRTRVL